jgi:histidinol-phosphatase (PHP family)
MIAAFREGTMKITSNYHTHSTFCDGLATIEEMVRGAIAKGITHLGISSHGPLPFLTEWTMAPDQYPEYLETLKDLKSRYRGKIELYTGLEIDFFPGSVCPFIDTHGLSDLEYFIGSVHFLGDCEDSGPWTVDGSLPEMERGLDCSFQGDIKKAVKKFYQLVEELAVKIEPTIIGHFDLIKKNNDGNRFFHEEESWYQEIVNRTLQRIAETPCIIEVNTGGIVRGKTDDLYPSRWILKEIVNLNIPITINSDAHTVDGLDGYFSETPPILRDLGFSSYKRLSSVGWEDVPL